MSLAGAWGVGGGRAHGAARPRRADAARRTQMSVNISSILAGAQENADGSTGQASVGDADDIAAAYEALCARATHFRDVRRDF